MADSSQSAELLNTNGVTAVADGDFPQAIAWFRRAIDAAPQTAALYVNLGVALFGLTTRDADAPHLTEQAIAAFQTALRLDATLVEVHGYLGAAYGLLGDAEAALRELARAPDSFFVVHRRGVYCFETGRFAEALAHQSAALALRPDDPVARYNRAVVLLTLGRLTEGWQEYGWRHQQTDSVAAWIRTQLPAAAVWQGEDIVDRHLLLVCEQGLGDMLQFARYIPHFAARCRQLSVYAPVALHALLGASFPGVEFRDTVDGFDIYAFLMDAGERFGLSDLRDVPPAPYLRVPQDAAQDWGVRLADLPSPRVGVVWGGRPGHMVDVRRSLPFADFAAALFDLPCGFVSLQKHAPPRAIVGEGRGLARPAIPDLGAYAIRDIAPLLHDWTDTARAILALDLVLSADTAVAHLAGALGKPVWLLNRADSCWRWGQRGSTTPWYPSMRIFRQPTMGDWSAVLQAVRTALTEWPATA